MSELFVQVPVSLIERTVQAIRVGYGDMLHPELVNELRAMLSQPTPTAEQRQIDVVPVPRMWLEALMPTLHKHTDAAMIETADRALDGTVARMVAAAPPRIEDMAPGTTFTAALLSGFDPSGQMRLWFVSRTQPLGTRVTSTDNEKWTNYAIDPSTIRDVTPPTDAA